AVSAGLPFVTEAPALKSSSSQSNIASFTGCAGLPLSANTGEMAAANMNRAPQGRIGDANFIVSLVAWLTSYSRSALAYFLETTSRKWPGNFPVPAALHRAGHGHPSSATYLPARFLTSGNIPRDGAETVSSLPSTTRLLSQ